MSDLKTQTPDLSGSPSSRIGAANRPVRDRRRRVSDLVIACFALFAACARPPPVTTDAVSVHLPEIWVDAFSQPGGDGRRETPLKALPSPLPPAAFHLRSGIYEGPFELLPGASLEGHGEVVLTSDAATTLTATGATLRNVTIQGGATGLAARDVTLERVTFSGQRQLALRVDGTLTARGLHAQASLEGVDGLVGKAARVDVSNARFQGGFRRGVDVSGGELRLSGVHFEGAKTAVRALDTRSTIDGVDAAGGSAAALFVAGGSLHAKGVDVHGYEFGVQLAREVDAQLSDVSVRGSSQSCISAEKTKLVLERARLTRCGPGGALALLDSVTTAAELMVRESRELGLFVRKGEATLSRLDVQGVEKGDALHVRDATVRLTDSMLSDCEGSGLFVSAAARVTGNGLQVERAAQSAVFVERGSSLELGALLVRGGAGPAVLVPDAATVKLGSLSVSGGREQPVYAECSLGARVEVKRLESTIEQLPSRCVTTR